MELPVVVALVTFLAVMLSGTALYLYLERKELVETWRRRAEGHGEGLKAEQLSGNILAVAHAQL